MTTIQDYSRYTQLMRNGFYDKLFFVDKLFTEWHSLLDYGCADGFLTKLIAEIFPDKSIVGYDQDVHMTDVARYTGSYPSNVRFISNLSESPNSDVLLLSSVIHEVESYYPEGRKADFWNYVFGNGFKMIIVRDMLPDFTRFPFDPLNYENSIRKACEELGIKGELYRFEALWGDINEMKSMTHFLLKYLYAGSPNWNREISENYVPLDFTSFIRKIPNSYRVKYLNSEALPYLVDRWGRDFGIHPMDCPKTHAKVIIEKK